MLGLLYSQRYSTKVDSLENGCRYYISEISLCTNGYCFLFSLYPWASGRFEFLQVIASMKILITYVLLCFTWKLLFVKLHFLMDLFRQWFLLSIFLKILLLPSSLSWLKSILQHLWYLMLSNGVIIQLFTTAMNQPD